MEVVAAPLAPRGAARSVPLDRVARAVLLALAAALSISLASSLGTPGGSATLSGRLGGDFPAFYGAGRIVTGEGADRLYDPAVQAAAQADLFGGDTDGYLYFAYPPAVAALYAPLAPLPYGTAYALHTIAAVGALVAALWCLRPMVGVVDRHFTVVLAAGLTFFPLFRAVGAGQNTAFVLLALAASWRLVHHEHDLAAGVVLGLAVAKPQLAIALVGLHLLARRWRVVAGAAVGAAAVWAASAVLAGPGWVLPWWEQAARFERIDAGVNGRNAVSWLGVARAVAGVDSPLAAAVGWGLAAATVAAVIWTWRHSTRHSLGPAMAVAASGVLLISPHAMFYDAGLMLLTGVVLADRLGRPGRLVLGGAWLLGFAHPLARWLGVTPVAAAVMLTFGIAVVEARRPPRGIAPPVPPPPAGTPDLSVVVPAWNEEGRLGPTLERLAEWVAERDEEVEVLVVDDGSTDGTARLAEGMAGRFPSLRVISHAENRGKGHAVRTGMLAATGRRRLFMDADGATDIAELDRIDAAAPDAAVAIASIGVADAEVVVAQPATRRLLGRAGNLLIRLAVLPGVQDSQRGFKVFRWDVAEEVFSQSVIDGWGFDVEVLGLARVRGHEVREVGVRWSHRDASRVTASGYLATLAELVRIQARLLALSARRTEELHAVAVGDRQPSPTTVGA